MSGGGRAAGLDFRLHLVQRAPVFRGLDPDSCREFVRLARDRRIVRRESFFLQGDPASDVFVLCAGRLKMTAVVPAGDEMLLRLVVPGEAFGSLDVASGGVYPAAAEALEPSHALLWDRCAFETIAERQPVLLRNVIRILSERMRVLEQANRDLATVRVPQRVAAALARLAVQIGRPTENGAVIALGREDLGQMTGTTAFTVSRLLADWEERGYVESRREAVVVVDAPGLARHVAADEARRLASNE